MKRGIGGLLLVLALAGPVSAVLDPPTDLALPTLNGTELRLSAFRGKVVLVNFWATWCEPCKEEIPFLLEFYKRYRPAGLEIVGISLDKDRGKVGPFVKAFGMSYPVAFGDRKLAEEWGIRGIPTSFFISRDGKITQVFMGPRPKAAFERELRALLNHPEGLAR